MSFVVLALWLDQHVEMPYLNMAEKHFLALETGLTVKQVADFCVDWRKRKVWARLPANEE
jgi:uncharacterized protein (DUF2132 family)